MFSEEGTQQGGKTEFPDFFPAGYRKIPAKKGRRTNKEKMDEITFRLDNPPIYVKATKCAECGDPTFQCSCPCQDQGLIPF